MYTLMSRKPSITYWPASVPHRVAASLAARRLSANNGREGIQQFETEEERAEHPWGVWGGGARPAANRPNAQTYRAAFPSVCRSASPASACDGRAHR